MEKQRLIIIAGAVFLGLMAVFMTKAYLDQQKKALQEKAKSELAELRRNQTPVMVAKENISKGTTISERMVEASVFPNRYVEPQAITAMDRVSGMTAAVNISKGEQITLSKLAREREAAITLSSTTPIGKRAMAIPVDDITSVGGMLKPGDHVDVIGVIPVPAKGADGKDVNSATTIPLFQNIQVLAVGKQITPEVRRSRRKDEPEEEPAGRSNGQNIVTLAFTSQEANFVAFVLEQGKVRLSLRSQADSKIEPIQLASWDNLLKYIMPEQFTNVPAPVQKPQTRAVEVYRGLKKEVLMFESGVARNELSKTNKPEDEDSR